MHNRSLQLFGIVALALAVGSCERRYLVHGRDTWLPGTNRYAVMVGKEVRTFIVHLPAERPRNRIGMVESFPLVVLLHGSGADGETIRRQSAFDSLADASRVIAVYPDGAAAVFTYGSDWNAGTCCGAPARDSLDDLGFIREAIDEVARHAPVDRQRIYIGGFSDGAEWPITSRAKTQGASRPSEWCREALATTIAVLCGRFRLWRFTELRIRMCPTQTAP
jgi:Poly(3-hydroxybutyrate) depolymerase